jgi:hypothetical protein
MADGKTTSSGIPLGKPAAKPPVSQQQPMNVSSTAQKYGLTPVNVSSSDPLVWMGEGQAPQPLSQVKNAYAFLSPRAAKKFNSQLDRLFPYGWTPSYIAGQWEEASELAAQATAQGKKIAPLDVFDNMLKNSAASAAASRGGGGGGGGAAAPTKTINLTDPGTAETLVDQALQGYLGRRASDKEITEFRKALTRAERGAPSEVNVSGDTATRSGGFNPATFAQQYAEGVEGAAEYQTATTFLDSFIGALGPRVDV